MKIDTNEFLDEVSGILQHHALYVAPSLDSKFAD